MDRRIRNARHIYERGIRDGDIDDGLSVLGERYTQHSQGVPDGPEGFRAFFEEFLQRHPVRDIELVRVLADDDGVFVLARQDLDRGQSRWVTFDWFAFDDDDRIVEHWDVIEAWDGGMPGGDVDAEGSDIVDLDRTEENRTAVHRLLGAQQSDVMGGLTHERIVRSCAMGNFVATLSEVTSDGAPSARGDLFRLHGGGVVEHWGVAERIGPEESWNNGGKF